MRVVLRLFTAIFILAMTVSASAQDAEVEMGSGRLAALMRFVPDVEAARQNVYFTDYRAAEAARQLEDVPQNYAEYSALDVDARDLWYAASTQGMFSPGDLMRFGEMPTAIGIDFFQIDQMVTWGPPDEGLVLHGDFDEESIRVAHITRGFVESELEGLPLWCSVAGCDASREYDLNDIQPADLFGGDLGRRFPRLLAEDFLISAAYDINLGRMVDAGIADGNSLAHNPAYQAGVEALDGDHYVRSVQFSLPGDFFALDTRGILQTGMTAEKASAILEQVRGGAHNLPMYSLVVFADVINAEKEYGVVGLVYLDEEDANTAAEILTRRINAAYFPAYEKPWAEVIADRGGMFEGAEVFHAADTDRYVTLLRLSKPLPPNERDGEHFVFSGSLYALLINSYYQRSLGWLQPGAVG